MQEIQNFVDSKINQDKTVWVTQILFQLFYSTEEYKNCERETETLSKALSEFAVFPS